ncbi:hypothetical protein BDZ89DRAFT_1133654 [Hymenopellis radicata]|nr:hypothetical protein BDZ89DRAFT_1133654 [Hymenopellis radicata]
MVVKILPLFRLIALSAVTLFSVIILGLSGHLIYFTTTSFNVYFTYSAMAIATAVLTIMTAPVMLVIDMLRKGAFTSMVMVEMGWLGILWVLWLTSAGLAANANNLTFISNCDYRFPELSGACKEGMAIEAFSFLSWLILMGYWGTLLVFSLIAINRGNLTVWSSSASAIAGGNNTSEKPVATGGSQAPTSPTSGWVGQQAQPQV